MIDTLLDYLKQPFAGLASRQAEEQDGIVQRYIGDCSMGRDTSDMDAHPMTSSGSLDDGDLTQEIRETLAGEGETISLQLHLCTGSWSAVCFLVLGLQRLLLEVAVQDCSLCPGIHGILL